MHAGAVRGWRHGIPWELALQVAESCPMWTGNRTQVLCKSHFSGPMYAVFKTVSHCRGHAGLRLCSPVSASGVEVSRPIPPPSSKFCFSERVAKQRLLKTFLFHSGYLSRVPWDFSGWACPLPLGVSPLISSPPPSLHSLFLCLV